MRTADITVGGDYACTPRPADFSQGARPVVRALVTAKAPWVVDVAVTTEEGRVLYYNNLAAQHVRQPWAEEQQARDLAQLKRDAQEAQTRALDAANDAIVRHFAEAFRGLPVPPGGTATFERDDVDLADRLIETFAVTRSMTASCEWEVFATVARRILELNELARQNALVAGTDAAGGWSA